MLQWWKWSSWMGILPNPRGPAGYKANQKLVTWKNLFNKSCRVNFSDEKNFNDSVKTRKLNLNIDEDILEVKNKTISQIKNFSQEENSKPDKKIEVKLKNIEIKNFDELIKLCNQKKRTEIKIWTWNECKPCKFCRSKNRNFVQWKFR